MFRPLALLLLIAGCSFGSVADSVMLAPTPLVSMAEAASQDGGAPDGGAAQEAKPTAIPVGDIDSTSLGPVISKVDEFVARGDKTITLQIHSPGGEVDSGQKFVEHLESIKHGGVKLVCIADGRDMSMAFYLLQACDERLATKRTVFLAHEPWTQVQGNPHEMQQVAGRLQLVSNALSEFIGARLSMGVAKYEARIAQSDWYFDWKEALRAGAIDRTIDPKDIPALETLDKPQQDLMQLLLGGKTNGKFYL